MRTLILTDSEYVEVTHAVNMAHDMSNDILLEDIPFYPAEVRELAKKSDDEIRTAITEMRTNLDNGIDRLVALKMVKQKLRKLQ